MENKILQGNALTKLKELPEKSINMCMTSPPYWALRDYGVDGQLGLESTFDEYINKLCDIFDEVKRVLRDDGTCWVNLGDTYNSGGNYRSQKDNQKEGIISHKHYENTGFVKVNPKEQGISAKSLTMIPFRFAIEMVNRGWILRNTIIWHKPNCMPSSVKDRFTVDFEYIFLFSKQKKYYFETQYEPLSDATINDIKKRKNLACLTGEHGSKHFNNKDSVFDSQKTNRLRTEFVNLERGRIKRTVWRICPKPFKEAHFAVYPEELCKTPIKAGCPVGGIVLDPFFGAGTTGLVALKQKKKFIGIELNKEYIEIATKRLNPFLEQTTL